MPKSTEELLQDYRACTNPVTRWSLRTSILDRLERYKEELELPSETNK